MKLTKEPFVHSHLDFEKVEKDVLTSASEIVSSVREQNIHSAGAEDDFLNDVCDNIIKGIKTLLDHYSNEYLDE